MEKRAAWTSPLSLLAALGALLWLSGCAGPRLDVGGPAATRDTATGRVLVDAEGMTLYTYDKDSAGRSTCTGLCALAWPPVEAGQNARPSGRFTLITRPGGSKQWAYDGRPLYGYTGDEEPGDVTGDGADGVWHVAHP